LYQSDTKRTVPIVSLEKRTKMARALNQIKNEFQDATIDDLPKIINLYESDDRIGVYKLVQQARKRILSYETEILRLDTMLEFERLYSDYDYICGIDEVGRGPFAGPVVAASVILPKDLKILRLNDSKQLSAKVREELFDEITQKAIAYGIGIVSPEVIDEINILQATYEAMRKAINNLSIKPDLLLNDAVTIPGVTIKQINIIHGDARSLSISAASVIAKVTRDRMMEQYAMLYPEYSFDKNMGYGTDTHRTALKEFGATPIHRQSFIKNWL
jgi:ribonuclease HII